ncbi:GTP cyclohydrolase II RibA [Aureimonas mangrovi]|uniref:GTP cyclohydrolase II RibA n=1 Tax=Aureimonas mangrovi TaxID=2758041 RepID=UPI001FE2A672|nr:GTP cyclohydrolase II RibA [Aureimonas mangrovi]
MNRIDRIGALPDQPQRAAFGVDTAVRCERAAAELRSGRPVLIEGDGEAVAVLSLDTATPDSYRAFAHAARDRHQLFLTAPRAGVLGLDVEYGALVPLAGKSFEAASSIGYLKDAPAPGNWAAADEADGEAAALARLSLLLPAVVILRDPDMRAFGDCLRLRRGDLRAANEQVSQSFEIVARTPVPLRGIEQAEFVVFRGGLAQRDQIAIVVGDPDPSRPVPVRVHSSCLTGDLFGSLKCDCGDQLRGGLAKLQERGGGVLVYLDQEGRGTGIGSKMRAYGLQCEGLDTVDADAVLGFGTDERRYEAAVAILLALGYTRVDLLTNNPAKIAHLRAGGIEVVGRTPSVGEVTDQNRDYLRTKARRAGHMIDVDGPDWAR